MQREVLVLTGMIAASSRAIVIVGDRDLAALKSDLNARDALLWNLTVIGEAAGQLPQESGLPDDRP